MAVQQLGMLGVSHIVGGRDLGSRRRSLRRRHLLVFFCLGFGGEAQVRGALGIYEQRFRQEPVHSGESGLGGPQHNSVTVARVPNALLREAIYLNNALLALGLPLAHRHRGIARADGAGQVGRCPLLWKDDDAQQAQKSELIDLQEALEEMTTDKEA